MPLRLLLRSDVFRIRGRSGALEHLVQLIRNRAYRVVLTYRLCRWCRTRRFFGWQLLAIPLLLLHRLSTGLLCSEVPTRAWIGPGFLLVHGYGVVINARARIGSNATLFHQVTIGASARGVPAIGDRVVVAAHAIVLGPVVVGDDAVVGAGSVLTSDVAANSVVAGNPARIIAVDVPGRTKHVWAG